MLKSQFDFLCETFGDPSLPINERWKAVRYIFPENPVADVQILLKHNEIIYIDNSEIGPGFYILGTPNADIEPINEGMVVTFIPLKLIDKITFQTDFIKTDEKVSNLNLKSNKLDHPDILKATSILEDDSSISTIIE